MVRTTDDTSSQCVVSETNLSQLTVGRDYTLTLQLTRCRWQPVAEVVPLVFDIESEPERRDEMHRRSEVSPSALQTGPDGRAEMTVCEVMDRLFRDR
jgi:hypothetical protein